MINFSKKFKFYVKTIERERKLWEQTYFNSHSLNYLFHFLLREKK